MYRAALAALATTLALPAAAEAQAACLIGPAPTFDPADAETVAGIVCSHLRKEGIAVGEPAFEATGEAWRVNLRPLGHKVFLSLQHVDANGAIEAESDLLLTGIEETPVAAPRLVRAIVEDKSVDKTATVSTLVGEETRRYQKKFGESFFGLGLVGIAVPGTNVVPGAGFLLRWGFESEDFAALSDLRFAAGSNDGDEAAFFAFGVGGRWFFLPTNVTPFLGGGVGWSAFEVEDGDYNGSKTGLGAFVEVGIEALRLYESRLSLDVRAELPFYDLPGDKYYVPLTVGASYYF
ncbi:hypothetical protein [Vulgatibacter sp.]|uniref:hypothetical protein n=1 Tax=Vulgatibacter sp. TaxID=1971226 RepID=UPI00356853A9